MYGVFELLNISSNMKMNILISTNRKFLKHAKEMLISLADSNNEFLNIFLLNNEIPEKIKQETKLFVKNRCHGKLTVIESKIDYLRNMPISDGKKAFFGIEAYNRLFCQFFLPENIDKILYLDSDILVNSDISKLYNMKLNTNILYIACKDESAIHGDDNKRLNLPDNYSYVNSGVLLINIKDLRKKYTMEEIINFIKNKKDILKYPDQDILNLLYCNEIKTISNRYNFILKDIDYYDKNELAYIIHYAGLEKPWKIKGGRYKIAYLIYYYRILLKEKKFLKLICIFLLHRIYYVFCVLKKKLKKITLLKMLYSKLQMYYNGRN